MEIWVESCSEWYLTLGEQFSLGSFLGRLSDIVVLGLWWLESWSGRLVLAGLFIGSGVFGRVFLAAGVFACAVLMIGVVARGYS